MDILAILRRVPELKLWGSQVNELVHRTSIRNFPSTTRYLDSLPHDGDDECGIQLLAPLGQGAHMTRLLPFSF